MPQEQTSWRHHYIPEFYLKRWCAGNGKLVEFSRPFGETVKPKRVSPKATGFMDRLYALEGLPGVISAAVEHEFFRPVDSEAAIVLNKMEAGQTSFDARERAAWTQFLISLVFRHPESIAATKVRLFDSLAETTVDAERRWRRTRQLGDPRTLREAMLREIERNPVRVARQAIELIAALTSSERIGKGLYRMLWGSMRMPLTVPALLTSDRPLHWFGGLEDTDCHILLPTGPKSIFWAVNTREMAVMLTTQPRETIARFVNEHTVRRARRFVYGLGDSHLIYVQKYMGTGQELSVADLITKLPSAGELRRRNKVFNPSWTGKKEA